MIKTDKSKELGKIYQALRTYMKGKYEEKSTFTGTLVQVLFGNDEFLLINKIVIIHHERLEYSIHNKEGVVEEGKLQPATAVKALISKVKKADKKGLFEYED